MSIKPQSDITMPHEHMLHGTFQQLELAADISAVRRGGHFQRNRQVRRIDTDLVFPSKVKPSKPIDLSAPWEMALKRAEVEDFHWYDLRHSAASYLAMNGASLNAIAAVLGQKTLAMVKRYAHLSEPHTASVMASPNTRIFGEG